MFISKEFDKKLALALETYNQRLYENFPPESELEKITFSKEFEEKMQKLIARQKKPYFYMINTVGKRVAVIIISFLIALTVTTFGVKAIRETVIEFITETFDKFTRITVQADAPIDTEFEKIMPEYIPEGYWLESDFYTDGIQYHIIYINNYGQTIDFLQQNIENSLNIDTEGIKGEAININSFEGILYENKGYKNVTFATENYCFTIVGEISNEEIIKIAESIKFE